MNENYYIVDTTLRDGEQQAGKVFSLDDKVKIANMLDRNNIYQIEAGIPAMGIIEKNCIFKIKENLKYAKISTWNRLKEEDLYDSFDCEPDIIHISVPTSDIQIYHNLNKDKKWIDEKIKSCVGLAKSKNYEVTIGFEDASRTNINYIIYLCNLLKTLDINRIRYADTVGILTPYDTRNIINEIKKSTNMEIEIHTHNDFGMALINAVEAVKSGAKYIDTTLDGIGERSGNCSMHDFIRVMNL